MRISSRALGPPAPRSAPQETCSSPSPVESDSPITFSHIKTAPPPRPGVVQVPALPPAALPEGCCRGGVVARRRLGWRWKLLKGFFWPCWTRRIQQRENVHIPKCQRGTTWKTKRQKRLEGRRGSPRSRIEFSWCLRVRTAQGEQPPLEREGVGKDEKL